MANMLEPPVMCSHVDVCMETYIVLFDGTGGDGSTIINMLW